MSEKRAYLPRTVRILGVDYDVIYDIPESHKEDWDERDVCGLFMEDEQAIYINPKMRDTSKIATLIHEIIEAINYRCELNLKHQNIMTLEAALIQVFNDNPRVMNLFKRVEAEDVTNERNQDEA